jgi:lipopolysaccharide transport system ATP-binding protein
MSDVAIRVEGLGKQYRIGGPRLRYHTLRESLVQTLAAPWRAWRRLGAEDDRLFWALRDVSFEVNRGDVMGITGRNGAGKSTLLKILSRITEPTTGEVELHGRVGSLLEVGTGFHQELTGRENVYLNGAILGMRREEITHKFDEIVTFAEVERFIDTPVKHYSSGMYMRLAFAVAAHLEPEILIVDEVLAVGDAQFQSKCLGKMGEVARGGRTVLFVSHNMGAIKTLTNRCCYLAGGQLALDGSPDAAIAEYLGEIPSRSGAVVDISYYRRGPSPYGDDVLLRDVYASTPEMRRAHVITASESISINVVIETKRVVSGACVSVVLFNARQERVALLFSYDQGVRINMAKGTHTIRCTLPSLPLSPGDYYVDAGIAQAAHALSWDVVLKVPMFAVRNDLGDLEWHDRPWGCIHLKDVGWQVAPSSRLGE